MASRQGAVVTWRGEHTSAEVQEGTRRGQEGRATRARSLPGARSSHTCTAREHEDVLVSVLTVDTEHHADSGQARLQGWAQDTAGQVLAAPEVGTGEVLLSPAEQSRARAQEGVTRLPQAAHCPPPGVATTPIRLLHPGRCAVSAASPGRRRDRAGDRAVARATLPVRTPWA